MQRQQGKENFSHFSTDNVLLSPISRSFPSRTLIPPSPLLLRLLLSQRPFPSPPPPPPPPLPARLIDVVLSYELAYFPRTNVFLPKRKKAAPLASRWLFYSPPLHTFSHTRVSSQKQQQLKYELGIDIFLLWIWVSCVSLPIRNEPGETIIFIFIKFVLWQSNSLFELEKT